LANELVLLLSQPQQLQQWQGKVATFFNQHRHATTQHMAVLNDWLLKA